MTTNYLATKERIVSFDALRFIFCIFIILHHIGINIYSFYQLDNPYFHTAHLAVECFFVLSGFLIAKHFFSTTITKETAPKEFGRFFFSRLKRLYPEYVFSLLLCLVLTNAFSHHVTSKTFLLNMSLLAGWGNIVNIINGIWYVTILFWGGMFIYSLLCFWKDKARFVFLPLVALICLFYLVNHGQSISGHQYPIEFNLLSKGTIRGLLGLCAGFFCFSICRALQNSTINFNTKITTPLLHILEITASILLVKLCLLKRSNGIYDFNIYYYAGFIISLLYFKKEWFLKFLSWKIWKHISYLSYIIYLTHLILIEILRVHWPQLSAMNPFLSYSIITILCILFGFICYHAQKFLFKKLTALLIKN